MSDSIVPQYPWKHLGPLLIRWVHHIKYFFFFFFNVTAFLAIFTLSFVISSWRRLELKYVFQMLLLALIVFQNMPVGEGSNSSGQSLSSSNTEPAANFACPL